MTTLQQKAQLISDEPLQESDYIDYDKAATTPANRNTGAPSPLRQQNQSFHSQRTSSGNNFMINAVA